MKSPIPGEAFTMNFSCAVISFRKHIGIGWIAAWLAVFLAMPSAEAQQPETKPASRPKVALVFEGGGALGFAHIGVIDWIESHHIPVDYVAGTSMGGLVGGLYASGMSPQEITNFVSGVNWNGVLSGQLPLSGIELSAKRRQACLSQSPRVSASNTDSACRMG